MRWSIRGKEPCHDYLCETIEGDYEDSRQDNYAYTRTRALERGPRDDRVRHPRRRPRGDRDHSHSAVPTEAPRAMGRHSPRNKRFVSTALGNCGQATVEFTIIMAGFLALTVALGALWHAFDSGLLVEHAIATASHHVQAVAPATITDIFLY